MDSAAEACFRQALNIARRQGARAWELQAALSVSRDVFGTHIRGTGVHRTRILLLAILNSTSEEIAFHARYVGKPFYTAIVLRPYERREAYLIDLTDTLAGAMTETPRSILVIPLGTPITITALHDEYILARIEGYGPFQIMIRTRLGTLDAVAEELSLVLSETPPLQSARLAMRPFIVRQEVTTGMSRREVYMSWGQPDKVLSSPGASGFLEEWVYFERQIHLILSNGFVTNWQQY
jgi:hypothetical protein